MMIISLTNKALLMTPCFTMGFISTGAVTIRGLTRIIMVIIKGENGSTKAVVCWPVSGKEGSTGLYDVHFYHQI